MTNQEIMGAAHANNKTAPWSKLMTIKNAAGTKKQAAVNT